jgi:hypothetical protein
MGCDEVDGSRLAHWDGILLMVMCKPSDYTRESIQLAFNPLPHHLNSVIS